MIYVSRTGDSDRIRPPLALPATAADRPATLRRLGVALAMIAVIASVLGAVVILGAAVSRPSDATTRGLPASEGNAGSPRSP